MATCTDQIRVIQRGWLLPLPIGRSHHLQVPRVALARPARKAAQPDEAQKGEKKDASARDALIVFGLRSQQVSTLRRQNATALTGYRGADSLVSSAAWIFSVSASSRLASA